MIESDDLVRANSLSESDTHTCAQVQRHTPTRTEILARQRRELYKNCSYQLLLPVVFV